MNQLTPFKIFRVVLDRNDATLSVVMESTYKDKVFTLSEEEWNGVVDALVPAANAANHYTSFTQWHKSGVIKIQSRKYNDRWLIDVRRAQDPFGLMTKDGFSLSNEVAQAFGDVVDEVREVLADCNNVTQELSSCHQAVIYALNKTAWKHINMLARWKCNGCRDDECAHNICERHPKELATMFLSEAVKLLTPYSMIGVFGIISRALGYNRNEMNDAFHLYTTERLPLLKKFVICDMPPKGELFDKLDSLLQVRIGVDEVDG